MAASDTPSRFFIVYQDRELWSAYIDPETSDETFTKRLRSSLGRRMGEPALFAAVGLRVVDRPSQRVGPPRLEALAHLHNDPSYPMVIALVFEGRADRLRFDEAFKSEPVRFAGLELPPTGMFADLPMSFAEMPPFQHCCPGPATPSLFGDRVGAERLVRAQALRTPAYLAKAKHKVNVILVDQGVDGRRFPGISRANGWPVNGVFPFAATGRHGAMIARNVLALAPTADLFDCPLLPDRITTLQTFLSLGSAAYIQILLSIALLNAAKPGQSWVISNAWGVYDLGSDQPPGAPGNYSHDPTHYFNALVGLCQTLGADVVFAAGNCGEFCPNERCHPDNTGPGRSIFGANGLNDVLTVGAVRFEGTWLGYSSEGPGVPAMQLHKPDLCAPSQFAEVDDASLDGANSGTSAACGVAAGVVAALRTRWTATAVPPAKLRQALRSSAFLPVSHPDAWLRYGSGIVDAHQVQTLLP